MCERQIKARRSETVKEVSAENRLRSKNTRFQKIPYFHVVLRRCMYVGSWDGTSRIQQSPERVNFYVRVPQESAGLKFRCWKIGSSSQRDHVREVIRCVTQTEDCIYGGHARHAKCVIALLNHAIELLELSGTN